MEYSCVLHLNESVFSHIRFTLGKTPSIWNNCNVCKLFFLSFFQIFLSKEFVVLITFLLWPFSAPCSSDTMSLDTKVRIRASNVGLFSIKLAVSFIFPELFLFHWPMTHFYSLLFSTFVSLIHFIQIKLFCFCHKIDCLRSSCLKFTEDFSASELL